MWLPHRQITALPLLVLIAGTACGRKHVVEVPEPENASPAPSSQPTTTSLTRPASSGTDRTDPLVNTQRPTLDERIYFGFDRSDLSPAARTVLMAKAAALRTAPSVTLRIEGHADERGSDEYNMALSNRRAAEAKRFLVQQGLDAGRFEAVGYGEEQPLDTGHDEHAWSMNRRAEFRITGGPGSR